MPACFQLFPLGSDKPANLAEVDDKMRAFFKQPADDQSYLAGWFDSIGFRLALGRSFEEIRKEFAEYNEPWAQTQLAILDWIELFYTPYSFYTRWK